MNAKDTKLAALMNMYNSRDTMLAALMDMYDSDETLTKPEWMELLHDMYDVVSYEHWLDLSEQGDREDA